MFDALILYSFSLYWSFHVLNRSDLLAKPRAAFNQLAPQPVVYASQCAFCFTFWMGLLVMIGASFLVGAVAVPFCLCAAPVVNLVLDLVVKALLKVNEPPVLMVTPSFDSPKWDTSKIGTATTTTPAGSTVIINYSSPDNPPEGPAPVPTPRS